MSQKDIISKQIIKRIFIDVATHIFKLDLQEVELLETEQQRIEDRRADLVADVIDSNGKKFIVHLEIQNQNQTVMPQRMLRYLTDILLSYPNRTVYQYLLYIGKSPLLMASGITTEQLQYRYQLIDMHEIDYRFFMQQNTADALVLAVLCDFKAVEPRAVVHEILQRLIVIQQDDPKGLREYVSMLEILAHNRNLNLDIKQELEMLDIEIERLPSFLIGEERGIEKGSHDKAISIAQQLFKMNLSVTEIAEITGLTTEVLEQLRPRP